MSNQGRQSRRCADPCSTHCRPLTHNAYARTLRTKTRCSDAHDAAVAAQRYIPDATGPTAFLKQLGVITSSAPHDGAKPLRSPTSSLYYLTDRPTVCLELLRAAFEHVETDVESGLGRLRLQRAVIDVLVNSLIDVSLDTAPYLANKLVHWWARNRFLSFADCRTSDLANASGDIKKGLELFGDRMPLSFLEKKFGVTPPVFSEMYCLIENIAESLSYIETNIKAIEQNLNLHIAEYKFPPQPKLLLASGPDAIQYPRKRRKEFAWEAPVCDKPEAQTLREQLAEAVSEAETLREQLAKAELRLRAEHAQPAVGADVAEEVPEQKGSDQEQQKIEEFDVAVSRRKIAGVGRGETFCLEVGVRLVAQWLRY